jgi:hypothetical protein
VVATSWRGSNSPRHGGAHLHLLSSGASLFFSSLPSPSLKQWQRIGIFSPRWQQTQSGARCYLYRGVC